MDDWLIFQYHLIRAQPESEVLREPLLGLPTRSVLGQRRGDAGGQLDPGVGRSWGKCVGRFPRQIRGTDPETRCRAVLGEASDPMLPRKASSEWTRCPYPKPTQVGT